MDRYLYIIIFEYLVLNDLIKMKDINYVKHPLVWKNKEVRYKFLHKLKGFPIQQINMRYRKISDVDFENICDFLDTTIIHSLYLSYTNISDKSLKRIKQMNLRELDLDGTNITDDGLVYISNMPIQTLNLSCTKISDNGLKYIRNMNLYELDLSETNITDKGLQNIRGMNLKILNLDLTKITDEGLKYICGMDLHELNLEDTNITDEGLTNIYGMTNLKELVLVGTQILDVDVYLQMFPNTHIIFYQNMKQYFSLLL